MGVTRFAGGLEESKILDAYSIYLQKQTINKKQTFLESLLAYDEFKEYYILKLLGRASEFTNNIARDFQYVSLLPKPIPF